MRKKPSYWKSLIVCLLLIIACSLPLQEKVQGPRNFREAKQLAKQIHRDHRLTFYCGCHYDKHNKVDLHSCGYKIQQSQQRAQRLEWEHIVPVSLWGRELPCWTDKVCYKKRGGYYNGRACCRDVNQHFSKMEADLHNIVPEIGELNGIRSNYRFQILSHMPVGQFGLCEVKVDPRERKFEPRPLSRGIIARAYLYMADTYNIRLSDSQRKLFWAWNREFPPDDWEIQWDKKVAEVQGNFNAYIAEYQNKR